ncbi:type I-F CRISPR-associated protein Csy3 [Pseudobacteriovorax antillogorgiicola]|uniref:CRISPR-associated protein, Csy3 family n=1 Tax=Pseudobacteriovorax antillogorgiicola TaxID=1513793 RepID=A0A1Y6C6C8_9BACT|nr:type I-F CRISPR-associated protein Csy3 [Pseudobacteriovorax antillogorgiicola]TCS49875.1 CRISPR-associated Csy3 family protein [Pseudobacteriovorax antillogorgiicola]SMF44283.1 CRISPR-associated protein, Csy3 family [Pseudobacteriovorax antillogorgiicola]
MSKKDLVSVLAFEKKIIPSAAYMYSTAWERREKEAHELKVEEKSVRGTISNRLKKALKSDPLKLDAEVQKPNLQTVDACSLPLNHDTLKVSLTLKFLGGLHVPSACNHEGFLDSYRKTLSKYTEKYQFLELSRRYITNIANARFLWRNRVGSEKIEVVASMKTKDNEKTFVFDSYNYSTRDFEDQDQSIEELAREVAETLSSEDGYLLLKVDAYSKLGEGQEVYPSEELIMDKGKGKKGKVLYNLGGIAALHSQKIGNAIRCIDTWYPDYNSRLGPIAIEPYGSVTNMGKAFRQPKLKADFYTLFDKYARGGELEREEDEHYVMAVLIRGGVFGESDK